LQESRAKAKAAINAIEIYFVTFILLKF
jgi:hypothetical protein